MQPIVSLLVLGAAILLGAQGETRRWTSRTGDYQVDAELIAADEKVVVLKRASDGRLLTVPLEQFSDSDVEYLRRISPSDPKTAATGDREPIADPGRSRLPPVAVAGKAVWQAAPDPYQPAWSVPDRLDVNITLPLRFVNDDTALYGNHGPFLLLPSEKPGFFRQLWDLRTGTASRAIREETQGITKFAISPDGQFLAVASVLSPGKLDLWSFKTGKLLRQIELGAAHASIHGLDFAGSNRLVVSLPLEKGFTVWDVNSGKRRIKIDIHPVPLQPGYAVSPGGHYLAVGVRDSIQVFDLRNGVAAGTLTVPHADGIAARVVQMVDFAADGEEIAAVVQGTGGQLFCCWSFNDGSPVVRHELDRRFLIAPFITAPCRTVAIDWLPPARGWLLASRWFMDRTIGGPVPISARSDVPVLSPLRRVVDERRMLVLSATPDSRLFELVPIPWEEIADHQRLAAASTPSAPAMPDLPESASKPQAQPSGAPATSPGTTRPAAVLPAWQAYVSQAGGYEVQLPGKPEVAREVLENTPRAGLTSHVVFARVGRGENEDCVVWHEHVSFPHGLSFQAWRNDAATLLKKAIDSTFERVAGKTISEKDVTLAGHPGKEVLVHLTAFPEGIYSRQRIFVIGSTVFGVGWFGSRDQVRHPDVDRVLDSFKLGGPRDDFRAAEALKHAAGIIHYDENGNIRQLNFAWDNQRADDDLAPLTKLAALRSLKVCGPAFTERGLQHLGRLTQLEELSLSEVRQMDSSGLVHLRGLQDLRVLHLGSSNSHHVLRRESGFRALESLTELRDLILPRSFEDQDVSILNNMKKLERLSLGFSKVTLESLTVLSELTALKDLDLAGLPIDDAFLIHVGRLTQLEELGIQSTRVTDKGLTHLESLKNLRRVWADRTALTPEGKAKLEAKIPGLNVRGV